MKQLVFSQFPDIVVQGTNEEFWKIYAWSMYWLYMGVHPECDWNQQPWTDKHKLFKDKAGEKLADGLFGMVYCIKGDLDYFTKGLFLRNYNSNELCDLCPATRHESTPGLLYNNFSESCEWKHRCYNHRFWRSLYTTHGRFLHWIFQLPGVNQHCIEPDELHVWHGGGSQYFQGSALWVLVHECMEHEPAENMEILWRDMCVEYNKEGAKTQYTNLQVSSFWKGGAEEFPCLRGKAAEAKDSLSPLATLWLRYGKSIAIMIRCVSHFIVW